MSDDERARRYHRHQLVLAAAGLVLGLSYLLAVLVTGVARDVAEGAGRLIGAWWWQVAVVTVALGAAHEVLVFPLAWVGGYVLPCRWRWLASRSCIRTRRSIAASLGREPPHDLSV